MSKEIKTICINKNTEFNWMVFWSLMISIIIFMSYQTSDRTNHLILGIDAGLCFALFLMSAKDYYRCTKNIHMMVKFK